MTDTPLATSLTSTIADAFGFTTMERVHLGGLIREGLGKARDETPGVNIQQVLRNIRYWANSAATAEKLADAKLYGANARNHADNALAALPPIPPRISPSPAS